MAGSFATEARFVVYSGPVSDTRIWVTVPAWAHRVTAPLIKRRGLDLFQRVILGLSEAGVRQPDKIGKLTGLHPRLCAYIMDDARRQGLLGKADDVTEQGTRALRTSVVTEDTEWSVRYVFTDPVSGDLWPRAADRLDHAYVRKVTRTHVTAELGTTGSPAPVTALRIPVEGPGQEDRPALPRPEQVMQAVRRDQVAREAVRQQELQRRYNLGPGSRDRDPAGDLARVATEERLPELTRISFIDEPTPVEILAVIEAAPPDAAGPGWIAHDPFGVGVSGMFSDLVATWVARHPALAEQLERMIGRRDAEFADQHRKGQKRARERVEGSLVREHGPELRSDRGVLDKLIDARLAEMEQSPGKAMHATFALFEELMFRICVAYPMSAEDTAYFRQAQVGERAAEQKAREDGKDGEKARQAQAKRSQSVVAGKIRRAAESIGAYELPDPYLVKAPQLISIAASDQPRDGTHFGALVAACIVAAVRRGDHPLRALIKQRPSVLFELNELRNGRNGQAHRLGERTVDEDLQWCHDLATLVVPALLTVPGTP
jgi:hypothetical protein